MELLENPTSSHKAKPINLKKEIKRYLKKWPWFLLSMALFFTAAKIYLRYVKPQYTSRTSLMVQESKGKSTIALNDMKNLGMGVSGNSELEGETVVVVSKPILEKVVKNLNLDVSFISLGKIKEIELYAPSSLSGKIIKIYEPEKFRTASYILNPLGKNTYKLTEEEGQKTYTFQYGVPAKMPFGTIQIDKAPEIGIPSSKVIFKNTANIVKSLENSISVNLPPNKGLMMELSVVGPVPKKSEDILNELAKQYIDDGINDKNREAENTQNFINDRLTIITEDLSGIESEKENFKKSNKIVDLQSQANIDLSNLNDNTKQALNQSMQLDLVNSVISETSVKDRLLPSGLGLSQATENNISEYNTLILNRNRVLKQATNENPAVIQMDKQIQEIKNLIRKNLVESRETLQLQLAQSNAQLNLAKGNIDKFPTREKVFRSIDRQQNLKEQLYLYLLQKREENAITLAVTAPRAKVINPAYTSGIVEPNYNQIIYGSLAIGFLLPLLFFYGVNKLDTKVHDKQHITSHIYDASVIAEIPEHKEEYALVNSKDFTVFAESFRILSSNLKYLLKAKGINRGGVVLITSSIKGEGKTTVCMNTAFTLAGKSKVIVIGADIRNPQLHRFVKGENIGLTDYLVSDETIPDKYIINSGVNENLDVLFSGQIAPNPNDLLDMDKFDEMINYLKTKYDYVVLDSAPVMLVSDTLHLVEISNVVLYIVKSDFTDKEMIDFAEGFRKENDIKNMAYILNGVKPENTRYGKKYGYGYYSYTHDEEPKGWRKFFKI